MVSKKEVKHIAKLARLGLKKKEIEKMQSELSSILDYFELLKEAEPSSGKTSFKKENENVTREDKVEKQEKEIINKLFQAVPKKEKGYVRVKSIFGPKKN